MAASPKSSDSFLLPGAGTAPIRKRFYRAADSSRRGPPGLVDPVLQRFEELECDRVSGVLREGALELEHRLVDFAARGLEPPQVQVGEMPRLVARRLLGLLVPGDRLVQLLLLHEIAADVVVGISEGGVGGD